MKKILAIILTTAMLLTATGCNNEEASVYSENSTATTTAETSANTTSSSTTEESAQASSSDTSQTAQQSDFSASFALSSTWEEGGNYCGGYEVVIQNNTKSDVENWEVKIQVPDGFKTTNSWNGKFDVSGTTLTVTNESYNGAVSVGKTASFGFNFSSPKEFEPSVISINNQPASIGTNTSAPTENPADTTTEKPVETAAPAPSDPSGTTPVEVHGKLSVSGTNLVDKNGNAYQLVGMSTHGIAWFPDFVNKDAFKTLRDDWNTNVVRLAMYTGNNEGYTDSTKASHEALVKKGIDICIELGMYVIVDWHVLADQTPMTMKSDAIRFFKEIATTYSDCPNIIYEICNEPNGNASWAGAVKPYAEEVIPAIRAIDADSVIIVGTPTWSQDIDKAMADPLDFDNVLYALHFYAATHTDWLRQRVETCVKGGLPIFVSEFGCCDASGNGANDFSQTTKWLELLDKYNISYINWNLANKNESSSAFTSAANANGNWSESVMSEGGKWMRNWFKARG